MREDMSFFSSKVYVFDFGVRRDLHLITDEDKGDDYAFAVLLGEGWQPAEVRHYIAHLKYYAQPAWERKLQILVYKLNPVFRTAAVVFG